MVNRAVIGAVWAAAFLLAPFYAPAQDNLTTTDQRAYDISADMEQQRIGPINFLGLTIPKDFPVRLNLTISNKVSLDVCGNMFEGEGKGGTFAAASDAVTVTAGEVCSVVERYTINVDIDSLLVSAELAFQHEETWNWTPEHTGTYRFSMNGKLVDGKFEMTGDAAGSVAQAVVGTTAVLDLKTTRAIPPDDFAVVDGKFTATLNRTAEMTLLTPPIPPEDLNEDGRVDTSDLVLIARDFGKTGANLTGDLTGDGAVDIADLVYAAVRFSNTGGAQAPALRVRGARLWLVESRLPSGMLRVDIKARSPAAVAAFDVELDYDAAAWELAAARSGGRLPSAAAIPIRSKAGTARLAGVSIPLGVPERLDRPLASFWFRPLRQGASVGSVRWRGGQLSGQDARRIPVGSLNSVPHMLRDRPFIGRSYPNPFNPEVWIPFELSEPSPVRVSIYASNGRLARVLDLGRLPAGLYLQPGRAAHWDGRNALGEPMGSGLYFYRIEAGGTSRVGRMLMVK